MKRIMTMFIVLGFLFLGYSVFASGTLESTKSSMATGLATKETNLQRIVSQVPTPQLTTAQERMMVAKRALLFDVDHKIGYVYIMIAGTSTPLGYYVIVGKVASLNSFLVPTQRIIYDGGSTGGGNLLMDDADLDGTYGSNIEGVFFFTDTGTYVELPTNGPIGYIYADQPLPIRVPKLNVQTVEK